MPVPVSQPPSSTDLSLLSLGSSHVLLASIPSHSSEICLLLWDLAYSVLLASHTFPIPSSLAFDPDPKAGGIAIELVAGTSTQALLALSPKSSSSKSGASSKAKSTILVVPYGVPPVSTIANAMGRAESGKKWLAKANVKVKAASASAAEESHVGMDVARTSLLKTMRSAVEQNRPEAADAVFFEWLEKEQVNQKQIVPFFLLAMSEN